MKSLITVYYETPCSISDRIGCDIRQTLSIRSELDLQGIALNRPTIGIGILLTFLKWQELVLVFY